MRLSPDAEPALLTLLDLLQRDDYAFVPPTPASHERVIARPAMQAARDLRGIFGWSLPFLPRQIDPDMLEALRRAGVLLPIGGGMMRSAIRVARVRDRLFIHSAFPTEAEDAVFFGPDSYRFVDLVRAELGERGGARSLADIGGGSGVGAIMAAELVPGARLTLTDVNPAALRIAGVNARHAGLDIAALEGEGVDPVSGDVDLIIANPPFIMDPKARTYRDGGDMHGARLSLDWTLAGAVRLAPGGRMILYTGVAIVDGRDPLRKQLEARLQTLGCSLRYRELDPDIFGEELAGAAYADVERIAAVGAVIDKD